MLNCKANSFVANNLNLIINKQHPESLGTFGVLFVGVVKIMLLE